MNTQDYIESGILEQYALGELTEIERAEVERQAAAYPEIRQELDTIMHALDAYAQQQQQTPPAGMRERVLAGWQAAIRAQPDAPTAAAEPEAVVRPLVPAPAAEEPARFNWMMAASIGFLVLSLGINVLLYSRWQDAEQGLALARSEQTRVASTMQAVEKRLDQRNEEVAILRSDEFRTVTLNGTKNAPDAKARVFFNPDTRMVYVDVRNLPAPPPGKQYQLWALDKGQPIDAGVLGAATVAGDSLQLMNTIANAQAFAMTVENAGGSPTPTLSTMAVLGQVL